MGIILRVREQKHTAGVLKSPHARGRIASARRGFLAGPFHRIIEHCDYMLAVVPMRMRPRWTFLDKHSSVVVGLTTAALIGTSALW